MIWAVLTIHLLLFPLWFTVAMPSKRSPLIQSHQYYQAGFITLLKDIRKYTTYTSWSTSSEISKGTKLKWLQCAFKLWSKVQASCTFNLSISVCIAFELGGNRKSYKLKMINFKFLFLPQFRNQLLLPLWETFRKVETLCWLLADLNTAVSAGIYSLILRCFVFFTCLLHLKPGRAE